MKTLIRTLFLSGLALLLALDAAAHIGTSRRVGNLNLTLSIMHLNESPDGEDEISTLVEGIYGFQLYLLDIERNYQPVEDAVVRLTLSHDEQEATTLSFTSRGQGEYFAEGGFDRAGSWTGSMSILLGESKSLMSTQFTWDVLPMPSQGADVTWADWIWIAAAVILAAGALVWWQLGRKPAAGKR